jgi:hypothetical protein
MPNLISSLSNTTKDLQTPPTKYFLMFTKNKSQKPKWASIKTTSTLRGLQTTTSL